LRPGRPACSQPRLTITGSVGAHARWPPGFADRDRSMVARSQAIQIHRPSQAPLEPPHPTWPCPAQKFHAHPLAQTPLWTVGAPERAQHAHIASPTRGDKNAPDSPGHRRRDTRAGRPAIGGVYCDDAHHNGCQLLPDPLPAQVRDERRSDLAHQRDHQGGVHRTRTSRRRAPSRRNALPLAKGRFRSARARASEAARTSAALPTPAAWYRPIWAGALTAPRSSGSAARVHRGSANPDEPATSAGLAITQPRSGRQRQGQAHARGLLGNPGRRWPHPRRCHPAATANSAKWRRRSG